MKNKVKETIKLIIAVMTLLISSLVINSFAESTMTNLVVDGNTGIHLQGYENGFTTYCLNKAHAFRNGDPLKLTNKIQFKKDGYILDGQKHEYDEASIALAWIAQQEQQNSTMKVVENEQPRGYLGQSVTENASDIYISEKEAAPMQKAVWKYATELLQQNQLTNIQGNNEDIPDSEIAEEVAKIKDYVQQIKDYKEPTLEAVGNPVSVQDNFGLDNTAYIKIGPLTTSYSGTLKNFDVYANNGEKFAYKIYKYDGKQLVYTESGLEDANIKDGAQFFILIDKSNQDNKNLLPNGIKEIKLETEGGIELPENGAEAYLFANVLDPTQRSVKHQDQIVFKKGEDWKVKQSEKVLEINHEHTETGKITIRQFAVNESGDVIQESGELAGARFVIREREKGYVSSLNVGTDKEGIYEHNSFVTNKNNAEFITGEETDGIENKGRGITIIGLEEGNYTVEEVKAPTGYKIDEKNPQEFRINEKGEAVDNGGNALPELHFHDKKIEDPKSITIKSHGMNEDNSVERDRLPGTKFTLKVENTDNYVSASDVGTGVEGEYTVERKVQEGKSIFTTNKNEAIFNTGENTEGDGHDIKIKGLPAGRYLVEEIEVPSGYSMDEKNPQRFIVDGQGNTVNEAGNALPELNFNNKVTSTTQPSGQDSNAITIRQFAVNESGDVIQESGELAGARFVIRERNKGYVSSLNVGTDKEGVYKHNSFVSNKNNAEFITGEETDGIENKGRGITIIGLEEGNYTVEQVKAPTGYKIDEKNPQEFRINEKGEAVDNGGNALPELHFHDKKIEDPKSITIKSHGINADNSVERDRLPGTKFTLKVENTNNYVSASDVGTGVEGEYTVERKVQEGKSIFTTNKNEAIFNTGENTEGDGHDIKIKGLPAGRYLVEEIEVPSGYSMDEKNPQRFIVDGQGNAVNEAGNALPELNFNNKKTNNNNETSEAKEITIKSYGINVDNSVERAPLPGTKFALKVENTDNYVSASDVGTEVEGEYTVERKVQQGKSIFTNDKNGAIFNTGENTEGQGHDIKIKGLPAGTYQVEEIEVPSGYSMDEKNPQRFIVDGQGNVVNEAGKALPELHFNNKKNNNNETSGVKEITIRSYGINQNNNVEKAPLPGTKFALKVENTNNYVSASDVGTGVEGEYTVERKVQEGKSIFTNDKNGAIFNTGEDAEGQGHDIKIKGLPAGTYQVEEIEVPSGYSMDEKNPQRFIVDGQGNVVNEAGNSLPELHFLNKSQTSQEEGADSLTIRKFACDDNNKVIEASGELAGAWFVIQREDGQFLSADGLQPNDQGGFIADKTTDKAELAGFTTGDAKDGVENKGHGINLTNIPEGKYKVTESIAPTGYEKSEQTGEFIVGKDGKIRNSSGTAQPELHFWNKSQTKDVPQGEGADSITIRKFACDANDKVIGGSGELAGAWFVIQREDGQYLSASGLSTNDQGAFIADKTTDKAELAGFTTGDAKDGVENKGHGITLVNIPQGKYKVTETVAPTGYEKSEQTGEFIVGQDGKIRNGSGTAQPELHFWNKSQTKDVPQGEGADSITIRKFACDANNNVIGGSGELAGAWFVIQREDGQYLSASGLSTNDQGAFIADKTTDKAELAGFTTGDANNGVENKGHGITLVNIPQGKYKVTETVAPTGYEKSEQTGEFIVGQDGKIRNGSGTAQPELHFWNKSGSATQPNNPQQDNPQQSGEASNKITIRKYESDASGNVVGGVGELTGAGFTIRRGENEYVSARGLEVDQATNAFKFKEFTATESEGGFTTGSAANGEKGVPIEGLPAGTYTVKEVHAPEGYQSLYEEQQFIVGEDGNIRGAAGNALPELHFHNPKNGVAVNNPNAGSTITIRKYGLDESGTPVEELTGAGFTIRRGENEYVSARDLEVNQATNAFKFKEFTATESEGGFTTGSAANGEKGIPIEGLPAGTYTVREVQAPEGYETRHEEQHFTVGEDGKIQATVPELHFHNPKLGTNKYDPSAKNRIIIRKYAGDSNGNIDESKGELENAGFTIRRGENEYVDAASVQANDFGEFIFGGFKQEPTGFATGSSPKEDEKGIVLINLDPGTYTVSEFQHPEGYDLSASDQTFTVGEDGKVTDANGQQISELKFINMPEGTTKERAKITIRKYAADKDGNKVEETGELAGAWYTIQKVEGDHSGEYISANGISTTKFGSFDFKGYTPEQSEAAFTTGSDEEGAENKGQAINIANLEDGKYRVKEVTAPIGYQIADQEQEFTIENGVVKNASGQESSEIVFLNKPLGLGDTNSYFRIYKYQENPVIGKETFADDPENPSADWESHLGPGKVMLPGAKYLIWYEPSTGEGLDQDSREAKELAIFWKNKGMSIEEVKENYQGAVVYIGEEGKAEYDSENKVTEYKSGQENSFNQNQELKNKAYIPGENIEDWKLVECPEDSAVIDVKALLPGKYMIKEVVAPGRVEEGTGEVGLSTWTGEGETEKTLEAKGEKGEETINDFQIDESPPQEHDIKLNVDKREVAFNDETAAGIKIRKYDFDTAVDYDTASDEVKHKKKTKSQFTIQLKEGSVIRWDEQEVSKAFEGGFLDPAGLVGDYTSEEGAQVVVNRKKDAYKLTDQDGHKLTHETAMEAGYVFEADEEHDIYISHLIPGTYIIREVDSEGLSRVEVQKDDDEGKPTDATIYKAGAEEEFDIENAKENGIEVYTRKKEWHHPEVEFWNEDLTDQITIEKINETEEYLKDSIFAVKLIDAPQGDVLNLEGLSDEEKEEQKENEQSEELKNNLGKFINPQALQDDDPDTNVQVEANPENIEKTKYLNKEKDPYIAGDDNTKALEEGKETSENIKEIIKTYGIPVETGKIRFKNLVPGTYEIWELEAPESYVRVVNSKKVSTRLRKFVQPSTAKNEENKVEIDLSKLEWTWPVEGVEDAQERASSITNAYGEYKNEQDGSSKAHLEIDIATKAGAKILAASDGKVTNVASSEETGNQITISHSDIDDHKIETVYSNLNTCDVKKGQKVKLGDSIGTAWDDKDTAHIGFAVKIDGKFINPLGLWTKDEVNNKKETNVKTAGITTGTSEEGKTQIEAIAPIKGVNSQGGTTSQEVELLGNKAIFVNKEAGKIVIDKTDEENNYLKGAVFAIKYEKATIDDTEEITEEDTTQDTNEDSEPKEELEVKSTEETGETEETEDETTEEDKTEEQTRVGWEGKFINPLALADGKPATVKDVKVTPTDENQEETEEVVETQEKYLNKHIEGTDPYIDGDENTKAIEDRDVTTEILDSAAEKYGIKVETGRLELRNLEPGIYKIYELKVPEGGNYLRLRKPTEVKAISVKEAEKDDSTHIDGKLEIEEIGNKAEIVNKESGDVIIDKIDERGARLKNAVIALKLNKIDENAIGNKTLSEIYKAYEGKYVSVANAQHQTDEDNADGKVSTEVIRTGNKISVKGNILVGSSIRAMQAGETLNTEEIVDGSKYRVDNSEDYAKAYIQIGEGENLRNYKDQIGFITDETGRLVIENLVPGTYSVIEIQAPAGYKMPENHKTGEGDLVYTEINNEDARDEQTEEENTTEDTTEDVTEDATTDTAEDILNEIPESVTNVDTIVNTEDPGGTIRIIKHDAEDETDVLRDAIFSIQYVAQPSDTDAYNDYLNKYVGQIGRVQRDNLEKWYVTDEVELVTDDNGEIEISNLLPGTYRLKEIKAPRGYVDPNGKTTDVVVSSDGEITNPDDNKQDSNDENKTSEEQVIETKIPNDIDKSYRLRIRKFDEKGNSITDKPLTVAVKYTSPSGNKVKYLAKDGTYSENEKTVIEFTNEISFQNVKSGTYEIKEVTPPEGYEKDETVHINELFDRIDSIVDVDLVDKKIEDTPTPEPPPVPGSIGIKKMIEGTSKGLKGFRFNIEEYPIDQEGYDEITSSSLYHGTSGHCAFNECNCEDVDPAAQQAFNSAVRAANAAHSAREEAIRANTTSSETGTQEVTTDAEGFASLEFLAKADSDNHGKYTTKETSVGNNPYFEVEEKNVVDHDSHVYQEFFNRRLRVDVEGVVFEDKAQGTDPNGGNHIFDEGELKGPVEVTLYDKNGHPIDAEVTTDGRYSFRVQLPEGQESIKDYLAGAYIEFTYNGLKYQSVFEPKLDDENGSKAVETEAARKELNEKLQRIVSKGGALEQNVPGDAEFNINFEKSGNYKRKIKYEGQITGNGLNYSGEPADLIGNGQYTLTEKRVPHSQVDKNTEQEDVYEPEKDNPCADNVYSFTKTFSDGINKYQITSTTKAGVEGMDFQGFNNYSLEDDKISNINLGVYKREQPDLSLVNDIEEVVIKINNQEYTYQYGKKTEDPNSSDLFGEDVSARFEKNKDYKYQREIYPSDIQIIPNSDISKKLEVHVRYKTIIRNETNTVRILPNEIVSYYDSRYTAITDVTGDLVKGNEVGAQPQGEKWRTESSDSRGNSNKEDIQAVSSDPYAGRLKTAYRTIGDSAGRGWIPAGQEIVMYTDYLLPREACINIFNGTTEENRLLLNNYVEINQYISNQYDQKSLYTGPAYAGVDIDSVAGNGIPGKEETYEDDFDEAPAIELSLTESGNRKLKGNVFDDLAREESIRDDISVEEKENRNELKELLADGINNTKDTTEEKDYPVNDVAVELVEVVDGVEQLKEDGTTKALIDDDPWSYDPIFGTVTQPVTPTLDNFVNPEGQTKDVGQARTLTGRTTKNSKGGDRVQADGEYILDGYVPGTYLIKFTWGGKSIIVGKTVEGTDNYQAKAWPEQYKNTVFVDRTRYNSYQGDARWYLRGDHKTEDNKGKSNALDVTSIRKQIDDNMKTISAAEEDKLFTNIEEISKVDMESKTPTFEVPVESDTDREGLNDDRDRLETNTNTSTGILSRSFAIDNLDFGITERPKTKMTISKRIDRLKVILRTGNSIIDASVVPDGTDSNGNIKWKLEGSQSGTVYLSPAANGSGSRDIGTMKIEMDKELLKGATVEITYLYTVNNESNLDFVIESSREAKSDKDNLRDNNYGVSLDKNDYYYWQTAGSVGSEVEMKPDIILDYLDNELNYLKRPDDAEAPIENDLWERLADDTDSSFTTDGSYNKQSVRLRKYLFDATRERDTNDKGSNNTELFDSGVRGGIYERPDPARADARLAAVNKQYWTIVRDQTAAGQPNRDKVSGLTPQTDQDWEISLKADQNREIKFIASKKLDNTTTDTMSYNNSIELVRVSKSGGALPETEVYGNGQAPGVTLAEALIDELSVDALATELQTANIDSPLESDEATAATVTFTPPTGDSTNYLKALYKIIAIVALCVGGVGVAIVRKIVIRNYKGKSKKS